MKARVRALLSVAALAGLLLLPGGALACACCSNAGEYHIGFGAPGERELGLLRRVRFAGTARLFLTEAGLEESARGLAHHAENYTLSGSLVGRVWRLTFREGSASGTLDLPMPAKMLSYRADIHDGQTSPGGGPLLYKEWRFEGQAGGTGLFRQGIVAPTRYFLVLQGRGNACDNAEDFTHWRLKITGKKADYAFFGELGRPRPEAAKTAAAGYRIEPEDQLDIRIDAMHIYSPRIDVDARGMIDLPFTGEVRAAGRTAAELAAELERALARFLKAPKVHVRVLGPGG